MYFGIALTKFLVSAQKRDALIFLYLGGGANMAKDQRFLSE